MRFNFDLSGMESLKIDPKNFRDRSAEKTFCKSPTHLDSTAVPSSLHSDTQQLSNSLSGHFLVRDTSVYGTLVSSSRQPRLYPLEDLQWSYWLTKGPIIPRGL